jgi:ankyrin repeat protein
LLDNGSRPNGEILLLAMERQKFNYAKQFIEAGVDINYQYPSSSSYADGMTPLLYASRWNDFELVNLLINKGANINTVAKDGSTALSIAKRNENSQIYNFLQERGAAEYINNNIQPSQSTGISGIFDNQTASFLTGTYRLSGRNIEIKFSGDSNSGSVNYTLNGRAGSGTYRIYNNNLTVTMEGQTFLYKIDSNYTFSGNGEVWVRTRN